MARGLYVSDYVVTVGTSRYLVRAVDGNAAIERVVGKRRLEDVRVHLATPADIHQFERRRVGRSGAREALRLTSWGRR